MRRPVASALLALMVLRSTAHADDLDVSEYAVEARPHVKAAYAAFVAADYATSVREWEAAYALDRNPQLLYSWAQAERLAKRCGLAIQHYRKYLEFKVTDNQSLAAHGGIAMCLEQITKTTCDAKPATIVNELVQPGPAPWYRDPADGAVLAGIAGIGVGVGFLFAASASRDRADHAAFSDDQAAALDEATGRRRIGIMALSLGAVVGGVGTWLFVRHRNGGGVTIGASAGAGGASLAIGGPL